jgi:hypothetical protein
LALRLVAGIALYSLILHSVLFAFHSPALPDLLLDPHALCLAAPTDAPDQAPTDQEPAKKHPADFCPICMRLAGLQLGAPPPAAAVIAIPLPRRIVLVGESDREVAVRPAVRPHSRGPPALA